MSRTLPNLGLKGDYDIGVDDWGGEQNDNLLKLSVLVQGGIKSRLAAVPGVPAAGDVHVLTAGANAQKVAVYDDGAWVYFTPSPGWFLYDNDVDSYISFDGTAWDEFSGGGGGSLPAGGTTGQVLTKQSNADGDADWDTPPGGGAGDGSVYEAAFVQGATSDYNVNTVFAAAPTAGNILIAFHMTQSTYGPRANSGWRQLHCALDPAGRVAAGVAYKIVEAGEANSYKPFETLSIGGVAIVEISAGSCRFNDLISESTLQVLDHDSTPIALDMPRFRSRGAHLAIGFYGIRSSSDGVAFGSSWTSGALFFNGDNRWARFAHRVISNAFNVESELTSTSYSQGAFALLLLRAD